MVNLAACECAKGKGRWNTGMNTFQSRRIFKFRYNKTFTTSSSSRSLSTMQ